MYRPRSTAVWFNLPGVVAAYQPVGAPGSQLARINVANEQRMPGRYTAAPGVAPDWSARGGWGLDGSTQYLATGISPTSRWTFAVAFSNAIWSTFCTMLGQNGNMFSSRTFISGQSPNVILRNGGTNVSVPEVATGVAAASDSAWLDGLLLGSLGTWSGTAYDLFVGAMNASGSPTQYFTGNIRSVLIVSGVVSTEAIALMSHQMAWCHANPDWSAWGRRRRYYYAPSAAAGRAFSPIGSGVVGSSVVRRIAA